LFPPVSDEGLELLFEQAPRPNTVTKAAALEKVAIQLTVMVSSYLVGTLVAGQRHSSSRAGASLSIKRCGNGRYFSGSRCSPLVVSWTPTAFYYRAAAFSEDSVHSLAALGFGPFFQEQSERFGDFIPARIAAEHRGGYEAWTESATGLARLSGKLRHEQEAAAVGDWVVLHEHPGPDRSVVIEQIFERRTVFTRGAAGRQARPQIVAANVDQVFIVCGLDEDFSVHRIERYLARVWASGATPSVILNKADLCDDVPGAVREVEGHAVGVPIYVTRALAADGLSQVAPSLDPGTTTAFVGSSGAGKSTLINALVGTEAMVTGETRASDGCGRHTTTHRQLVMLPQGGLLLDTPGMRELQLLDEEGLDRVFDDIETLAALCRFRDCRHENEPGCAVREAARIGELGAERLDHYRQLQREARSYERRHDEHLRRQSERVWGQLHEEAARLRKWKGG
jgi:ribosome biogenesis GTPase